MPDYTYTQIFPNLAETQHDLEVWLSKNVVNEEEGTALWSLTTHTHADAIQIDSDQATGWTLPTTLGEIASTTITSGLEGLEATDQVLVDVTAVLQASGLAAGTGLTMRIALQDVLQDQTITFFAPGTGTASGTTGAGSSHTHTVSGTSAAGSAHHHTYNDTTGGPNRDHYHGPGTLAAVAAGGHTHAAEGSHTHGGTGAGTAHYHWVVLSNEGTHRHTDPVSGYTGYQTISFSEASDTESTHTHSIASGGSHDHDTIADHAHTISGLSEGDSRTHTHTVIGSVASESAHTHAISLTSGTESTHTHTFSSAHSHTTGYVAGSLRCVATVTVGAGKSVKVSVYANTETSTATVNKVSFDGLIWVVPQSLAAQLGGLDDLEDVDTPAPTDGQVLTWSAGTSEWIAASALANVDINDLTDVTIDGTPANHEVLTFDSTTSQWVNHTAAEAGLSETSHNHDATYLGIAATAADSSLLDGLDSTAFALTGHNHDATYSALGHNHDATYLGIAAQAADSDTVDGQHAAAFATAGHDHAATYSALGHSHTVDTLSNVVLTDVQDNDRLSWDEATSKWVNSPVGVAASLDDIGDVTIASLADGDLLAWSDGAAAWVNVVPEAAAMGNLEDLADATITTPADNEVLAYDFTSGEWINQTAAEAGLATDSHNHDAAYISVVGTPTEGNFPQLTAGGELVNSTYDETSFATAGHNHDASYISVIGTPAANHFPYQTVGGELVDSGYDAADFATAGHNHDASYISVVGTPTEGNFPTLTAGGELANSAYGAASFATSGHSHTLDALSDVDASTVTAGYVIRADGTDWHSATLSLADLSDVGTTTATSGNVLSADGTDFDSKTLADAGIAAAGHGHATTASWTPSWYGTTGNPTMTHASGGYVNASKMCLAYLVDSFTATVGSGFYYFTLPVDADSTNMTASGSSNLATPLGTALLVDATGNQYVGVVTLRATAGTDTAFVAFDGGSTRWSATAPITPANGDYIMIQLAYQTA